MLPLFTTKYEIDAWADRLKVVPPWVSLVLAALVLALGMAVTRAEERDQAEQGARIVSIPMRVVAQEPRIDGGTDVTVAVPQPGGATRTQVVEVPHPDNDAQAAYGVSNGTLRVVTQADGTLRSHLEAMQPSTDGHGRRRGGDQVDYLFWVLFVPFAALLAFDGAFRLIGQAHERRAARSGTHRDALR